MHITGLYAALSTLLVLALALRVIMRRKAERIGIGDNGDRELAKRVRAHANAIETLPLGLLLLLVLEWNQTRPGLLHVFGVMLVAGRVLHAYGMSRSSGPSQGRIIGMSLTLLVLLAMAALLLWQFAIAAIL